MDYGSLIRTLEWAYWKQQANKERRKKKRARKGTSWISKKTCKESTDSSKVTQEMSRRRAQSNQGKQSAVQTA